MPRKAQEPADEHRGHIICVADYSHHFCDLLQELQEETIARTEHQGF